MAKNKKKIIEDSTVNSQDLPINPVSEPDFGFIGPNGIYKHSLRLLNLSSPEDIQFYEKLSNQPHTYIILKADIIQQPDKVFMLIYFAERIKELKALEDKYRSAEEATKIQPPVEPVGSLMDILTSPVKKLYNS